MSARSCRSLRVFVAVTLSVLLATAGNLRAETRHPNISPHELLRKAADYLYSAKNLNIEAQVEYDNFLTPSLLVQYGGKLHIQMSRPDRLFVDFQDKLASRKIWIDGKNVTYLDVATKHYSQEPSKKTVGMTLAYLNQKYGLTLPLTNLFLTYAFAEISGRTHAIDYLGKTSLDGATVHHVVAHGAVADIQVWIDAGNAAIIRKILIINHGRPFAPRYSARFTKIEKPKKFSKKTFTPVLPEKSQKTKMISIQGKVANVY